MAVRGITKVYVLGCRLSQFQVLGGWSEGRFALFCFPVPTWIELHNSWDWVPRVKRCGIRDRHNP